MIKRKRYFIFEPNTAVLSTNPGSFSGNDFSTGFIAREAFYTILDTVDRHSRCPGENWGAN